LSYFGGRAQWGWEFSLWESACCYGASARFEINKFFERKRFMNAFLEIRSYHLKPGMRAEYHRLFLEEAMPLLQRFHVDVVAYGPSLHDENSYYLMRRFDSLAQREQAEEAFYGSDAWRKGPREAVIACIENYTEFVIELDEVTVQALRK
jgi:NIPSNAP protein